jgi:hypothetical protein
MVCRCRCSCTPLAIFASIIVGVIAAFLQITGTITVVNGFLWTVFGIAVAYLAVFLIAGRTCGCDGLRECGCEALTTVLVAILGSVAASLVLLAVGIVATSVVSAILVGVTVGFFALLLTATACLVRSFYQCN